MDAMIRVRNRRDNPCPFYYSGAMGVVIRAHVLFIMLEIFNIIIGTAGHIDHGKSSLVRSLTGIDPDRLKEEKEREMTIDLGFAPMLLPDGRQVGIIDVPGHERFVKNMVAGATSIDFVILVIAADDGIMLQTREHVEIMQLLGIQRGMVALSKIDVVDQELVLLAKEEIREFLHGTFLQDAPIIGLSNHTKKGLDEFRQVLFAELAKLPPHETGGIFRMPIQRVFSKHGYGTIVTGVPVSGSVAIGDEVEILPGGLCSKVKKIQAYSHDVEEARAGHSTALNLKDIPYQEIIRGQVAAAPGYFEPVRFIEAKFQYLQSMKHALEHNTPIRFHTGTLEEVGQVAILGTSALEPGATGYVQLRLENPIVAATGDRFVMRLSSPMITIGGGVIIGTGERKLKRFREEVVTQLAEKEQTLLSKETRIENLLRTCGSYWLKISEIVKLSQLPLEEVETILAHLLEEKAIHLAANNPVRYIHSETAAKLEAQFLKTMDKYFQQFPHRIYAKKIAIRNLLHLEIALSDWVVDRLVQSGQLGAKEQQLFLPHRVVNFAIKRQDTLAKIEAVFLERLFQPPDANELADFAKLPLETLTPLLEYLMDAEILVAVLPDLWFHKTAIEQAKQRVLAHFQTHAELSPAEVREQLNTTRKYIIPLLEYFDQIGFTRRKENNRVLCS